ncbi:unnamed protein product [Brachionus calyciflorus]|uniref:Hexosyltransferase n=1 Tax=Brachionus calyciflorus TaxID=104777 RepID=A0A814DJY5_9BILA|nr:unnamed protein product [Brachionus calyciflorus]
MTLFYKINFELIYLILLLTQLINASNNEISKSNTTTLRPESTTTSYDKFKLQDKIVNRHDFEFILNPGHEICKPLDEYDNVFLLIYVHSSPSNFKRRLSLRETWAKRSMFRDIRIIFMMGDVQDKKIKNLIQLENGIYKDIVQENFIDAYRNLTYKGIMAMKWISTYCPKAKFILKVDDDIISNIFILLRHLYSLENYKVLKPKSIMCLVWVGMVVMRDKNSKWYLSKDEFKDDVYGKYCSGSAYMFTNDLPREMYNASLYLPFFWVDDYYISGLLARGVESNYQFFNSLYIISSNLVEQRFLNKKTCDHTVFGHSPGDINRIYRIWNFILKRQLSNFPNLMKGRANFINKGDFVYLKNFEIPKNIWDQFLKIEVPISQDIVEYDNF